MDASEYSQRLAVLLFVVYVSLVVTPAAILARSDIKYIPDKEHVETIILENETIRYTLSLEGEIKLASAVDKATGIDLLTDNVPLAFVSIRNPLWLDDVGFHLVTIEDKKTPSEVSVSVTKRSSYFENPLVVTQTFSVGTGPALAWNVNVLNSSHMRRSSPGPRDESTYETVTSQITFPLMQEIDIGDKAETHYLIRTQGRFFCIDSPDDFIFYFTSATDPKMPIDIFNVEKNMGIYFHIISSALDFNFEDKNDFRSRTFYLTQNPGDETVVLDCRISPHEGDWHAAFLAFKEYIRSNFDFTYYKRPIQEEYRQRFVSHFTFLYGHDIYDPVTNQFRINEFLDEGELNFGGYDYMLLWHDYPRMGIDNRDQFDMYEDLPGGLSGLRKMVDQAHARDVQVFIPYKPWDTMKGRKDHFKQEARIAEAINADGIFLDTMSESDIAFRDAVDDVNLDIVFVSEGRPDLEAARLVTGSWNQQGNASNKMPNVDLFRFIFPEHNVHNINRGARKRDELIYNALFNGTGLIVWEDIFGEINKFSWSERILMQRYSRIIHENRDAYLADNPVPLVADLRDDLYVNAFPAPEKCVYPVYQLGRENVSRIYDNRLIGPFMEVEHPDNWSYVDVWNHQPIPTEKRNGKIYLVFPEEPTDVMSVVVGLPVNLKVDVEGDNIQFEATRPLENASIHINRVNNLTMMEEEMHRFQGNSGAIQISQLNLQFPYKVIIKLMQGDILKDEVILDLGWKNFNY